MIYGDVVSTFQVLENSYGHLLLPHDWNTQEESSNCESVLNSIISYVLQMIQRL